MSTRRVEKVASIIRSVVSDAIANRLSDPRISPFASVTRVDVSGDLRHTTVFISVLGDEASGRKTMAGLEHAKGHVQSLLAKRLTTRQCPHLRFRLDESIKKGTETIRLIDQTIAEDQSVPAPADKPAQRDSGAVQSLDGGGLT